MTGTLLHKSDKQGKQKSILQQTLHKDNTFLFGGFPFSIDLSLVSHEESTFTRNCCCVTQNFLSNELLLG